MTEVPTTRFVRNGDVHLAYQIVGNGPIDLLLIDTWVHHVDLVWTSPTSPGSCAGSARSRA